MSLPINIKDLVHGHSVEWERLEFKRGWNPEEVIHSMCAFANDLHNWGGGYIVIGIETNNGMPVFPPEGLQQNQLDKIQNEVLKLGNRIQPAYLPIMQPYVLGEQHILVLWCPAGDFRPYSAPTTLGEKAQRQYYIRVGSSTVVAKNETLRRLFELAARVPFDDRINQQASIDDFDLTLIQAYLHEVKSDLYEESKHISLVNLTRNMYIAKGSDEYLRPVNVGLLFFSRTPEKFFDRSWIEVVWHKDDVGDNFTEHYFKGALHHQLHDALSFIKTNIIHEHVIKIPNQAEALRFYNYPYEAVEEALSNAVYHKAYDLGKPIEVQIFTDKITVLSYPGAMPPVDTQILNHQKIVARDYRNRRIGDFLKELDLTEGRGTGFPKMFRKMGNNGSPIPIIETDEEGNYFMVTLPINPTYVQYVSDKADDQVGGQVNDLIFNSLEEIISYVNGLGDQVSDQVSDQADDKVNDQVRYILNNQLHGRVAEILNIATRWIKRDELFSNMNLSNHQKNRKKYLDPLLKIGWVEMEFPDKKTSPNQRYRITESGKKLLKIINKKG
ncbi:MAG: putative DNA binding domain-containing protein [Candidatus Azobacteroides sp.]|nr:putative DNA binding domain-containing protein [Candidatus Azobacteroides sp.]